MAVPFKTIAKAYVNYVVFVKKNGYAKNVI